MGRNGPNLLRLASLALLLGAVVLFFVELLAFSRQQVRLPEGLTIAGVSVGGLEQTEALQRLLQTYSTPLELYYGEQLIVVQPSVVGFQLDAGPCWRRAGRRVFRPWTGSGLPVEPAGRPQSVPVRPSSLRRSCSPVGGYCHPLRPTGHPSQPVRRRFRPSGAPSSKAPPSCGAAKRPTTGGCCFPWRPAISRPPAGPDSVNRIWTWPSSTAVVV
jgi:hypothetical protein